MLTHIPRMRVCDHARATEQPWRRTGHGQGRAPSRACCCRSGGTGTRGPARSSARSHTTGSRGSAARQRGRPASAARAGGASGRCERAARRRTSPRAGFTRSVCARPMMPLKSRSSASTLPFRPIARSTKLHSSSGSTVKSAAGATLAPRFPSGLGVPSAGSCEGGGGRPGIDRAAATQQRRATGSCLWLQPPARRSAGVTQLATAHRCGRSASVEEIEGALPEHAQLERRTRHGHRHRRELLGPDCIVQRLRD
eukprot:COSAG04_NODE_446_length_14269_cov_3.546224_3_plen_254_part_00